MTPGSIRPGVLCFSMRRSTKKPTNPVSENSDPARLAAKVRAARAVLGWSQTKLGKRVGLTQKSVYLLELGAVQVRKSTATALETEFHRLGISFIDLQAGGFTMDVPASLVAKPKSVKRKASSQSRRGP